MHRFQSRANQNTQTIMVIYTYGPRATTNTMMKYSSKPTSSNNKKKNKKNNNKSKEVAGWDDIPDYAPPPTPTPPPSPEPEADTVDATETPIQSETKTRHGKWVHGTIPMSTIRRMKWGDIDELTDEEFGYYQGPN